LAARQLGRQSRGEMAYLQELQQDIDDAEVAAATVRRDQW
jgi:hypothetical protein